MTTRVGINGFGRIGRTFVRRALERADIEVVAVNDITDTRTLAHLLEFDSTYGRLKTGVTHTDDSIIIDGHPIRVLSSPDPSAIDWGELGVTVVVESTGRFRARDQAALHLKGGARKVLLSAPGKGADLTVVVGINDGDYDPQRHDVISNASCTTNCVAPMAKVLNDAFGLVQGLMTTIHAYTGDQMLLDGPHKDLRRARSAAVSIVPTTTGAARTTGQVISELAGRLDGVAVRVPVEDGSLTDLTAVLGRDVTATEINAAFEQAAAGPMAGILHYSTDPLVSRDIIGDACLMRLRLRPDPGGGQPGQGIRLVRQRMGLHLPPGRPHGHRGQAALARLAAAAIARPPSRPHGKGADMYRPLAEDGIIRNLVGAAGAAPSIHNTQPWRFRITDDVIEVHGDPDRMLWVADPRGPCPAPELRSRAVQPQARDPHARRQADDLGDP